MIDLLKISEISISQLNELIIDKLTELHNDCSKTIDTTIFEHTKNKFFKLLQTKYRSWAWGEVNAVMNQGVTESFGKFRAIDFATIAGWMKKAENLRSANYATKSITENSEIKQGEVKIFKKNANDWAPVIQMNLRYKDKRFESPAELKNAVRHGNLTVGEEKFLRDNYPRVFSAEYGIDYDPELYRKHYPACAD